MNHHVNAIAGRLSLRPPQSRSVDVATVIQDLLSVVIYLAIATAMIN